MPSEMPDNRPIPPPPALAEGAELWVFGYGSLMWNPEFDYSEVRKGRLSGWHRRFCVRSTLYRGTPEQPGLVLGLDEGGFCDGLVFRVAPFKQQEALAALWAREMRSGVYDPRWLTVETEWGAVEALTFVAKRDHPNFWQIDSHDEIASCIAESVGQRGRNLEYLVNTVAELRQNGVVDLGLEDLLARINAQRSGLG